MTDLVQFEPAQVELIKRTLLVPSKRQATNDELALFIGQAKRTGLDPFSRQIYGVFRWDSRAGGEKMTIQASIDGFRLIAERSGKYIGQAGPFWCDADTDWTDVWFKDTPPKAAKVIVRKLIAGQIAETPAVAHWSEYVQTTRDGSPMKMWAEKSALMLAKCAEALALRKAFPNDLSGLYTAEEMSKADTVAPAPVSVAPPVRSVRSLPTIEAGASDVTDALPWEEPTTLEHAVETGEVESDDTTDTMTAERIMGEIRRRGGMAVADFRAFMAEHAVSDVPSDLASAEKRQAFLGTLSREKRTEIGLALAGMGVDRSAAA